MKAFFTDGPISARQFWRLCLAVCLAGLALRLPTLTRSLWLDESYSSWFCNLPLHELWTSVPLYETHPPVYYSMLRGWTMLFGRSEAALRGMSVLASVATILLVAVSGRALRGGAVGDRVALLAALLLAVNRGSIQYAQQARPYAMETLAASAAVLFSLIVLQRLASKVPAERRWPVLLPGVIGLGVCAGATLWLHNTAIFVAFGIWTGMTIALLLHVPGQRVRQALAVGIAGILALLIWSPFIPMLIRQSASVSKISFWVEMGAKDLISAWYLATGGALPMVPMLVLCGLGVAALWRINRTVTLHICILLLLPLTVMLGYSFVAKPIYISRLFEWQAPSFMMLAAIGIWAGIKQPGKRYHATLAVIVLSLISTVYYYVKPTENWRGLIGTVAAQAAPGDVVIVYPNELSVVLRYYVPPTRPFPAIHYIPAPFPALGLQAKYIGNLGAPAIQASDAQQVHAAVAGHRRVWLISRVGGLYDRGDVIHKALRTRLHFVRSYGREDSLIELFE